MNGGDFKVTPQQLQQTSASLRSQATELLSHFDRALNLGNVARRNFDGLLDF